MLKKGDLLYPKLKVDYAIGGPSMVMWTVDGDIRDQLGDLVKSSQSVDDWYRRFDELLTRAQENDLQKNKISCSQSVQKTSAKKIGIKFTKIQHSMKTSLV